MGRQSQIMQGSYIEQFGIMRQVFRCAFSDENRNTRRSLFKGCSELVGARAPIRIDCRANKEGQYFFFDLNMKPNMTEASQF